MSALPGVSLIGTTIVLDVFRKRLNYPDLKRAVLEQARKHHVDIILIEDKASGTQLIQDLRSEGVYGIEPYDAPPGSDKTLRLYAQTAEFESGRRASTTFGSMA